MKSPALGRVRAISPGDTPDAPLHRLAAWHAKRNRNNRQNVGVDPNMSRRRTGGIKPALTRHVNAPKPEKGRKNENWQQRGSSGERAFVPLWIRFWQR